MQSGVPRPVSSAELTAQDAKILPTDSCSFPFLGTKHHYLWDDRDGIEEVKESTFDIHRDSSAPCMGRAFFGTTVLP